MRRLDMDSPAEDSLAARWLLRDANSTVERDRLVSWSQGLVTTVAPAAPDSGLFVMPALANAHDHCRGIANISFGATDQSLEFWLPAMYNAPAADPYLVAAVAYGRMVRGGFAHKCWSAIPNCSGGL